MRVLFIAGFGPIVPEMDPARAFYAGAHDANAPKDRACKG